MGVRVGVRERVHLPSEGARRLGAILFLVERHHHRQDVVVGLLHERLPRTHTHGAAHQAHTHVARQAHTPRF
eukprot:26880-Prymnesium_polylepis.1